MPIETVKPLTTVHIEDFDGTIFTARGKKLAVGRKSNGEGGCFQKASLVKRIRIIKINTRGGCYCQETAVRGESNVVNALTQLSKLFYLASIFDGYHLKGC